MKKLFFIVAGLVMVAGAKSQTGANKDLHNDLVKERNKRHEVARDLAYGNTREARADHRAAVAYHRDAAQDARRVHEQHLRQAARHPVYHPHHVYRRHHIYRRHHVYHRPYIRHRRHI
jgi:hypothetical protein